MPLIQLELDPITNKIVEMVKAEKELKTKTATVKYIIADFNTRFKYT